VILASISPIAVLTVASISTSDWASVAEAATAWAAAALAAVSSWTFTDAVSDATELLTEEVTEFIEVSREASLSPARWGATGSGDQGGAGSAPDALVGNKSPRGDQDECGARQLQGDHFYEQR